MKRFIYVLLIGIILIPSCRTEKTLTKNVSAINNERRIENEQVVCYIHDSVVVVRNDTAVVRETKWRDRIVEHTITKVDTVQVKVEKVVSEEKIIERKVIPRWAWWCLGVCVFLIVVLVIWIVIRVKRLL